MPIRDGPRRIADETRGAASGRCAGRGAHPRPDQRRFAEKGAAAMRGRCVFRPRQQQRVRPRQCVKRHSRIEMVDKVTVVVVQMEQRADQPAGHMVARKTQQRSRPQTDMVGDFAKNRDRVKNRRLALLRSPDRPGGTVPVAGRYRPPGL